MGRLKKEDVTGMATSILLHALLIAMLAFMTTSPPEEQPIGFLEVEFGPFAEGRPQPQAPERPEPDTKPEPEPEPVQEEDPPADVPEDVKPVELPDAATDVPSEDVLEEVVEEEPAEEAAAPRDVVRPLGSGSLTDDSADSGSEKGNGSDDEAAAPFQIEGLNRSPVATPLPVYAEQVNADIRVRITVNPQGRIVQRIPLMKGNPALERAVMDALLTWQFNPLPANAPQENQTGVISFRFRLR